MTTKRRRQGFLIVQFLVYCCTFLLLTAETELPSSSSGSKAFLLLCTTDGFLFTIDAWTGNLASSVSTEPLLRKNRAARDNDSSASSNDSLESSIVPGLDGRLYSYVTQQPRETSDETSQPQLQALPLTIHSILENPVRSCPSADQADCGILTATAQTTLLALDETGELMWKSQDGAFSRRNDGRLGNAPLLLQRKDYWVQHVSTVSGQQAWNVSLGTYQALDFATTPTEDEDGFLLGQQHGDDNDVSLPAIAFSNGGRTLTALVNGEVLWQQTTPSVLSSVFGIYRGEWKALTVLEDFEDDDDTGEAIVIVEQNAVKFAVPRYRGEEEEDWSEAAWEAARAQYRREDVAPAHHQEAVCLPGDCPKFVNARLGLPSPDDVYQDVETSSVSSQDGLLLSWRLVGMLTLLTLFVIVGLRLWYVQKKNKWMEETTRLNRRAWRESHSLDASTLVQKSKAFKRSLSLPGALKATSSPSAAAQEGTVSNEEKQDIDDEPRLIQQGGIPLVRYSRYASEFVEICAMGKGGFGTVFRCRNGLDGREYAVKKISIRGVTSDKSFQQRLHRVLREVKILALLEHPNIVRYYTAWLEMEEDDNALGISKHEKEVSESGMLRCYSSSLLLTDSVSQWETPSPLRSGVRHLQTRIPTDNPLGWDPFGIPEESTGSLRRQRQDEDSDAIFFGNSSHPQMETECSENLSADGDVSFHASADKRGKHEDDYGSEETNAKDASPSTNKSPFGLQEEKENLEGPKKSVRRTLYIQMQLCSERTVADFLVDETERKAGTESRVDIPTALQLFLQISRAVEYVHSQGMIHRDLKPSNCFMDASGNIKVGDFGLSRESGGDAELPDETVAQGNGNHREDHTAGVGTRSYCSPEQSSGSGYDSSTDIYSLGIILFELCYPMYTGMERNICLSRLREHLMPNDWDQMVGASFPTLEDLIRSMLNQTPSARPTASDVAQIVQSILGEFKLVSLDSSKHSGPDMILLRIEAAHHEDVLGRTIELIRSVGREDDKESFRIAQYGLRSSSSSGDLAAIMEFAVQTENPEKQGPHLVSSLSQNPEIRKVRQISQTLSQSNG